MAGFMRAVRARRCLLRGSCGEFRPGISPQGAHHQPELEGFAPRSGSAESSAELAPLVLAGFAQGAALVCALLHDSLSCGELGALAVSPLQDCRSSADRFLCARAGWLEVAAPDQNPKVAFFLFLFFHLQSRSP